MISKRESQKLFWPGHSKNKEAETSKEKNFETESERVEQATNLSEEAEKLAEQGYKEKDEQKIQEARKMLAKAREMLEGKEMEEEEKKELSWDAEKEITNEDWQEMKKGLNQHRKNNYWDYFAEQAAAMKILASPKVEISSQGGLKVK